MRSAYLLFSLLAAAGVCFGFGYHDSMTNGSPIPGLSPLSLALGSVKAVGVSEAASIFTNPAQTSFSGASLQVVGAFSVWKEKVLQSDIEKSVRTLTSANNFTGAVIYPVYGITLGAGAARVAEFSYVGTHTVFNDPSKPPVGTAILEASGGQWEMLGSVSTVVTGSLAAGFSGGVRTAGADYTYQFNSQSPVVPDSSRQWSFDEREFAWHAGLAWQGDLFSSGFSYSSGTSRMEDVLALGGSAFAAHLRNITVGFEAELASPADQNRFKGKLFIHMPLRAELNAHTSVSFDDQRVANRAGFGFGLGFDLELGGLNLASGVLTRFTARKNTAFPDEESDRVDDSITQFNVGLVYGFHQ
jgi:hypothetical protein